MKDWLSRLVAKTPAPVHTKLLGAFFSIVALLIIFGFVVLQVLSGVNSRSEDLIKIRRKSVAFRQLQHDTTAQLYIVTTALLSPNDRMLDSALRQLHQFRYDLERVQFVTRDEVELFGKIREEHEQLIELVTKVVELTKQGDFDKAMEMRIKKMVPLADHLERLTNEMVNRAEAEIVEKSDQSIIAYKISQWVVVGFAVGSIGLAVLLGYALSRSLMGPITLMDERLNQIASGDFSQQVKVPNRDELGTLADHLNRMSEELRGLYNQIETASHHKSVFLANVSHELRTPLNAIIGYSEMLMEDAEQKGLNDFIPDLRKIHSSGKHLLALINDILDLSKIEAGKMELSVEPFNVLSMIEEVASTVEPLAEKNANSLEIQCAGDLGTMHSDLTRVRQMLFNLLSNACKFTEKGTISLHAARNSGGSGDWLTVRVSDTGIGMTEKQMEKLFQPFSQVEGRTKDKYGGTGLGLVITKQFCEMMGGDISLKSEYGAGTTFSIRLPLEIAHTGTEATSALESTVTGGKNTHA